MPDYTALSRAAKIVSKRLEISMVDAEKAVALFEEFDIAKITQLDEAAEAVPMPLRSAAMVDLKKEIETLIAKTQRRPTALKAAPILKKRLGLSEEGAEAAGQLFDETLLLRLVRLDEAAESAAASEQAAAKAEAKKKITLLVEAAQKLDSAA